TKGLGEIKWMVALSRYSAGVYCAHGLIATLLRPRPFAPADPLWEVSRPFAVFALTVALVMTLAKIPKLRTVMT
ncbi:MAG: hypothetical protein JWN43_2830, partial [Gammaproteobacteria bacterium]|nr:hypothetical protein [Gammaproteobacteria bacterium]